MLTWKIYKAVLPWHLYKAVKVALYWDAAIEASSKSDYQTALNKMERIRETVPMGVKDKLFEGYLLYATGQDKLAIDRLAEAHRILSETTRVSDSEGIYLKTYASYFGLRALELIDDDRNKYEDIESTFVLEYDKIDLPEISRSLRRIFPLRDHPDWVEP